ncbi:MAG: hypothetical protein ACRCV0_06660 [Brevinema sp.]
MSKFIPILRTGRYKDASGRVYDITPQMLQEIKDSYKSKSAPLVKGHPSAEAPAMGWIDQLKIKGTELLASFAEVSEDFKKEVVEKSLYKNISASFYHPFSESNPNKGKHSLRHVGALGASRPAIPNLGTLDEALAFSENTEEITAYSEFPEPDTEESLLGRSLFEKMIKPFIEKALKKQREEIMAEVKKSLQSFNFSESDQQNKGAGIQLSPSLASLDSDILSSRENMSEQKTARELELEEKLSKAEKEIDLLKKEQDKAERSKIILEEVTKVKDEKNLDEATTKNLTEKAESLADKGVDAKEAVVNLSEFIPTQKKSVCHRFEGMGTPSTKGTADFAEGDIPLQHTAEFADEIDKLSKEGLGCQEAHARAIENLNKK